KEKPDVVVMGKQAVDGDSNQVGQMLAELLDWPMATFAATIKEEQGALLVGREVDGGVLSLRVRLPAVVTVDLRIVAPTSVYSLKTAPTFKYNDGVRAQGRHQGQGRRGARDPPPDRSQGSVTPQRSRGIRRWPTFSWWQRSP